MDEIQEIKRIKIRNETTVDLLSTMLRNDSKPKKIQLSIKNQVLNPMILQILSDYLKSLKELKAIQIKIGPKLQFDDCDLNYLLSPLYFQQQLVNISINVGNGNYLQYSNCLAIKQEIKNFKQLQFLELKLDILNNSINQNRQEVQEWFSGLNSIKQLKITLLNHKQNNSILKELSYGFIHLHNLEKYTIILVTGYFSLIHSQFFFGSHLKNINSLKSLSIVFKNSLWKVNIQPNNIKSQEEQNYYQKLESNPLKWNDYFIQGICQNLSQLTNLKKLKFKLSQALDFQTNQNMFLTLTNLKSLKNLKLRNNFNTQTNSINNNFNFSEIILLYQTLQSLTSLSIKITFSINYQDFMRIINLLKDCQSLKKLKIILNQLKVEENVTQQEYLICKEFLSKLDSFKLNFNLFYCNQSIKDAHRLNVIKGLQSLKSFKCNFISNYQNTEEDDNQNQYLGKWFKNLHSIQELEVNTKSYKKSTKEFQKFFRRITQMKTLKSLQLILKNQCNLTLQDAQELNKSLQNLNNLTTLNLLLEFKDQNFGTNDIVQFKQAFQTMKQLKHLKLEFTKNQLANNYSELFLENLLYLNNLKSFRIDLDQHNILKEKGYQILSSIIENMKRLKILYFRFLFNEYNSLNIIQLTKCISKQVYLKQITVIYEEINLNLQDKELIKQQFLQLTNLQKLSLFFKNYNFTFDFHFLLFKLPFLQELIGSFINLGLNKFTKKETNNVLNYDKNKNKFYNQSDKLIIYFNNPKCLNQDHFFQFKHFFQNIITPIELEVNITLGINFNISYIYEFFKEFFSLQNVRILKICYPISEFINQAKIKQILYKIIRLINLEIIVWKF